MAEERIPGPPPSELAPGAFELLAAGKVGVLSTLSSRKPGWPLGTLVSYALDGVGRPIFLFTELAQHTRNLRVDPRASLFVQEAGARNPQSSGRLALLGTLTEVPGGEMSEARDRYVAVHPEGRSFAELGDFLFWHMNVEDVHVVGGFAKAGWMSWQEFRENAAGK
jgi:putative heme iron utilization protein